MKSDDLLYKAFKIRFSLSTDEDVISGFELGDIQISYNDVIESSMNKVPDQSFMVFITITDLLFGVKKLLSGKPLSEFNLICVDSSYRLHFSKLKTGQYRIYANGNMICELDEEVLSNELYQACSSFYAKYKNKLRANVPVKGDIERALMGFKQK